jgi:hypothetical protein
LTIEIVILKDAGFNFWDPSQPPDTRGNLLNEVLGDRTGWLIMGVEVIPQSFEGGWILVEHDNLLCAQTVF